MLETNGTLPKNMKDLLDYIDIVSLDIKLPEHFNKKSDWEKIFQNELDTLKLLIESKIDVYVKLVVLPETKISSLEEIMIIMKKQISFEDIEIIIQPLSPISKWDGQINNLFNYSECIGKYYSVSVIPQIHPFLNIL